ncbi:hypothetical protein Cni_G22298 [Canna indica]|uniref:RNase H type-1 domain-containing protein n=1 Tax=Canna indica TaxID=4628 RepID=A0AAQ3QL28_9LILI|nr:hypothetical protein Cni_G22298 [Canna indica]
MRSNSKGKLSKLSCRAQALRDPIKAQALADFVSEFTDRDDYTNQVEIWTMFVHDASNEKGSGASIILENNQGVALEQSLQFHFKASNNQVEYEALVAKLKPARDVGAIESDS